MTGWRRRPGSASLETLVRRVADGDEAAFGAVYDATSSRVYGIARRVLRDPAQAEEVAQEVYLELWQKAGTFDDERGGAAAWLATIAHRRAVDRVRTEQARRTRDDRAAAASGAAPFDDVASTVEEADERARVAAALGQLTDLQRQAVELAYYGGLTYRQVAEQLGAPLGTVKSRLRDGLRRLSETLGGAR